MLKSLSRMKYAIVVLIVILVAISVPRLLALNNTPIKPKDFDNKITSPSVATMEGEVGLFIEPKRQIIQPQQPFQMMVMVESAGNAITGISVKILFDKNMITVDTPEVLQHFTNPIVFENTVDNKQGIVFVSLGSTTPITQSGAFLRVTGKFNPGASGDTDLIILPESKVTRSGSIISILDQTGQTTLKGLLY